MIRILWTTDHPLTQVRGNPPTVQTRRQLVTDPEMFARLEAGQEEVYVAQPDGFVDPDHPDKVPFTWDSGIRRVRLLIQQLFRCDHASCIDTRKITSGGIQFLGDKLVSWMSKKQDCTAMSSAEAEYVALFASCVQLSKITMLIADIEDDIIDPVISQAVNKSPTHYPYDSARTFRVILFSIHNDEWKSFQCHHQTALRLSALDVTVIHKDGDGDASFQLKLDSLPHAHAQTTKTFHKHQDSKIMKAQELKTKTSAQTLILKITP
ncbi:gag-pol polyprotein [Tanacetum coccineum]|uniref:Gag-pol polyprotein n=1 Tax=Tanacetum coccineum TaxID=301880 RepID=A0ABQ5F9P2_9ASTR